MSPKKKKKNMQIHEIFYFFQLTKRKNGLIRDKV